MTEIRLLPFLVCVGLISQVIPASQGIPPEDTRLTQFQSLHRQYPLVDYPDRQAWLARANYLRRHILISTGLWPLPAKTPLHPCTFDRVERNGYSVEKVYFESYPGLFVVGNLYRPTGKSGPFPAVLCPHGHWKNGRFENRAEASVPGRAINFALQGYVVFTYSMLGYNESKLQLPHDIDGPREQLWGVSSMGIQLWNSIRALDFLTSLPEVDASRIGVTGASGGGTQTFMLSAIDERVRVAAPVNMISLHMQGGCICENAPSLRIDAHNVEIGALMAPRPLILVSTSGDWTVNTPQVEFPAIRTIYRLFGAEDSVRNAHFNYGHNYNQDSREAVYAWFARWLQSKNISQDTREAPFEVEGAKNLEVFQQVPEGAATRAALTEYLINRARQAIRVAMPKNWSDLHEYRKQFGFAFRDLIGARVPDPGELVSWKAAENANEKTLGSRYYLGRRGAGHRVPAVLLLPADAQPTAATLVADGQGLAGQLEQLRPRSGSLSSALVVGKHAVLVIEPFPAGFKVSAPEALRFVTTYNRTTAAHSIQDILTGVAFLQQQTGLQNVQIVGSGKAGLLAMLAAALAEPVEVAAIDADAFDASDEAFIDRLFIPLLRRAGDLTTAAALLAPRRLLLFNLAPTFDSTDLVAIYSAARARELFRLRTGSQRVEEIAAYLSRSKH